MTRPPFRVSFALLFGLVLVAAAVPARAAGISYVGRANGLPDANAVAISPDGAHVYASAPGIDAVVAFSRDAASGALTQIQKITAVLGAQGVSNVTSIAISPDGKTVYATNRVPISGGYQGISVFTRDTGTGTLTLLEIQKEGVGGVSGLYDPRAVTVSGDGANVYARSRSALATFARNATTGALTFVGAETLDVHPTGSTGVVVSSDGAHVYTVGEVADHDAVLIYGRAPGTGALTLLGHVENSVGGVSGINGPRNLALSPAGDTLYVAGLGSSFGLSNDDFTVLARDAGTGALTYVEKHHESRPLRAIGSAAVDSTGQRAYFTSSFIGDASVGYYERDGGTGALTLGSYVGHKDFQPDPVGIEAPVAVVVSPDDAHLYVADGHTNGILIFDIRCGTGTVDAGEGCDDGNTSSYDGCDSSCQVETCWACAGAPSVCAPDDGIPCDDGTICTASDTCAGGFCIGAPDDGIACNDNDVCTIDDTCAGGGCFGSAEPEVGCRAPFVAGGASLKLKQKEPESAMAWKWAKGSATTVTDFGDPVAGGTVYTACVYQTPGLVTQVTATAGCSDASCWRQKGKGFKYRASTGQVRRIGLKAGPDGKAAIEVEATDVLPVPDTLPLTAPVTVQLKAWHAPVFGQPIVDGCWGATYGTPSQNDGRKLKARSD